MRTTKLLLLLGVASLVASCANLRALRTDVEQLGTLGELRGEVSVTDWNGAPIVIAVLDPPPMHGQPQHVSRYHRMEHPGRYAFFLEPGEYRLGAFEDTDNDTRLSDGERGLVFPEPIIIEVGELREGVDLVISEVLERPPVDQRPEVVVDRGYEAGVVLSLGDPRFGQELGRMGVWQPITWFERAKPGLYMLGEYDPEKTPVLFIHGMSGYPQEFESIIAGLDRERFQPWVFLYPSGFRLGAIANVLRLAVTETHIDHPFERLCVVGHSVGGIVAREYLNLHAANEDTDYIRGFVSIAAPFGGIPSAAKGVRMSPEVVPAWYDLVPDGPFIQHLYDQPLPDDIEYQLLMSHIPEEPSDGVVYISSQLRPRAQGEADVVRGYAETHGGVLLAADAIAQAYLALDQCRGDRPDAPRFAPRTETMDDRPVVEEDDNLPPALSGHRARERSVLPPVEEEDD